MYWPKDGQLSADQTGHAVLWHATLKELGFGDVPKLDASWLDRCWGDGKATRRLKTFGHLSDKASPHFLISRGGLPFHTDPGYTRYCLQIQVFNGGYCVHGLLDQVVDMPLFLPGLVILLDSWSPHAVTRDKRLPVLSDSKLLCGADYVGRPDIDAELPKLVAHLANLELSRP